MCVCMCVRVCVLTCVCVCVCVFGGVGGSGLFMFFFTTNVMVKYITLQTKDRIVSWHEHRSSGDLVVRPSSPQVVTNRQIPRGSKAG